MSLVPGLVDDEVQRRVRLEDRRQEPQAAAMRDERVVDHRGATAESFFHQAAIAAPSSHWSTPGQRSGHSKRRSSSAGSEPQVLESP